ncbi:hypothetical protein ACIA8F_04565 [Streptomyces sp. NPDC051563]|uniref:hypothetical protein n=1 Tax=Streptomyces sp. NPDC051563 TaxID=3365659 RepID=UPI00378B6185
MAEWIDDPTENAEHLRIARLMWTYMDGIVSPDGMLRTEYAEILKEAGDIE